MAELSVDKLKKAALPFASLKCCVDEARQHYKEAYCHFRELSTKATASQEPWLEQLAEAKVQSTNKKVTTQAMILQLKTREKQRNDARHIKRANGKLRGGGSVTMVIAPDAAGGRKECTTS